VTSLHYAVQQSAIILSPHCAACSESEGRESIMRKFIIAAAAIAALSSLSACETIGKGKGKAPPPEPVAAEPAPVYK
jgi:hypothetical protein